MRRNRLIVSLSGMLLVVIFKTNVASAQDLHFSQYFNSPLLTNPANTGFIPDANYRLGINYRDQWSTIPVPYETMSVFGDAQLLRQKLTYGWIGLGGVVLKDVAGSGDLASTEVYSSIAYHQLLGMSSLLSAGFNVGYAQKSIDLSKLTFGDQWNGKFFDISLPSGEYAAISQTSISYFDLQAGLNYAYFPNDHLYFNTGFSVQHINTPRETFYEGNNEIARRYIGFLSASVKLSDNVIFNPSGYFTTQSGAQEIELGGYFAYDLSGDGTEQLLGGAYYRVNDALIPMVGYQLSNIRMMFSYDATVSSLGTYDQHSGAYELSIIYEGIYVNSNYRNDEKKFRCPGF
jgi:type IX secretion system PorP/SprF family membrane protein